MRLSIIFNIWTMVFFTNPFLEKPNFLSCSQGKSGVKAGTEHEHHSLYERVAKVVKVTRGPESTPI
jgi:hypothetical protein